MKLIHGYHGQIINLKTVPYFDLMEAVGKEEDSFKPQYVLVAVFEKEHHVPILMMDKSIIDGISEGDLKLSAACGFFLDEILNLPDDFVAHCKLTELFEKVFTRLIKACEIKEAREKAIESN